MDADEFMMHGFNSDVSESGEEDEKYSSENVASDFKQREK